MGTDTENNLELEWKKGRTVNVKKAWFGTSSETAEFPRWKGWYYTIEKHRKHNFKILAWVITKESVSDILVIRHKMIGGLDAAKLVCHEHWRENGYE